MQNKLYMHRDKKNYWAIWGVIILLALANTAMIAFVEPKHLWIEIGELILLTMFLLLIVSWVFGRLKWGLLVTGIVQYLLILNRVGWLGWPSVGIGLVIVGLISLIY